MTEMPVRLNLVYKYNENFTLHQQHLGQMAERSKALASGASRAICVGSNPTLFINLFALCSNPSSVVIVEILLVVIFFRV